MLGSVFWKQEAGWLVILNSLVYVDEKNFPQVFKSYGSNPPCPLYSNVSPVIAGELMSFIDHQPPMPISLIR